MLVIVTKFYIRNQTIERSFWSISCKLSERENSMAIKRETIEPHKGDKRYARRDESGHFTKAQVSVGKSLAADRRTKSKTVVPKGQGDRGDQKK
jgi:hypothetical protein